MFSQQGLEPTYLTITCTEQPPEQRIGLHGELDRGSAAKLPQVMGTDQRISVVLLDLTDLRFCDVGGLRALLELRAKHLEQGRTVVISRDMGSAVRLLLQMTDANLLLTA